MLAHRAIGDKLTCVFVDNGLLRLNEADQIMEMFGNKFGLNIIKVDAEDRFLKALEGEAELKLSVKIIGHVFVDIFDEESKKLSNAKWLAQGTIYPDVIESAASKTGKAHVESNLTTTLVAFLMIWKWVLLSLYVSCLKMKYVRSVTELGLPYNMLYRHPFPGPGLGVRVLGEIKKSTLWSTASRRCYLHWRASRCWPLPQSISSIHGIPTSTFSWRNGRWP